MAAIEAMYHNLPLVLSDIPQHFELGETDKYGVFFFSDKEEFFVRLNEILQNRKNIQTSEIYAERFTQARMVEGYKRVYCEMIKEIDK